MRRQRRDNGPRLWVILDEAVLRRPIGGKATMSARLKKVVEAAGGTRNTIQMLPLDAGEHTSMGSSFSILTFADPMDPGIVYVETRAGSLYLEGRRVARPQQACFQHPRGSSASAHVDRVQLSSRLQPTSRREDVSAGPIRSTGPA